MIAFSALILAACTQTAIAVDALEDGGDDGICSLASEEELSQVTPVPIVKKMRTNQETGSEDPYEVCALFTESEDIGDSISLTIYPISMMDTEAPVIGDVFATEDVGDSTWNLERVEGLGLPAIWAVDQDILYVKPNENTRFEISTLTADALFNRGIAVQIARLVLPRLSEFVN